MLFTVSWWGGCGPFKEKLIKTLTEVNASNPKNVGVLIYSADSDEAGFAKTMKESPFVAVRFDSKEQKTAISVKHPISGFPTPIIMNGKTGEVQDPDAMGTNVNSLNKMLATLSGVASPLLNSYFGT